VKNIKREICLMNDEKASIKLALNETLRQLIKKGMLADNFVGKIVLNCNSGGITSVEITEVIR
jgi:hypothetical protein